MICRWQRHANSEEAAAAAAAAAAAEKERRLQYSLINPGFLNGKHAKCTK
jgi:hypothetical protein